MPSLYNEFRNKMNAYLGYKVNQGETINASSDALWDSFLSDVQDEFGNFERFVKGIEALKNGQMSPSEVVHNISDHATIHFIGLRGKTTFISKLSYVIPSLFYEHTRDNVYIYKDNSQYPKLVSASRKYDDKLTKDFEFFDHEGRWYDPSQLINFKVCGGSIKNVDYSALRGSASMKTESLHATFLLSLLDEKTKEVSSKKNALHVAHYVKPGQFKFRGKLLSGSVKVYREVEVDGKTKTEEVELEDLVLQYRQFFIPTINVNLNVLPHNVRPKSVSDALVYSRSKDGVELTENARLFKEGVSEVKKMAKKELKIKFIKKFSEGGGDIDTDTAKGKINVVHPLSELEQASEYSIYSHILQDSVIHYLLLNANPLAFLLTSYDDHNSPVDMEGHVGKVSIAEIDTCLQDMMRLFEPRRNELISSMTWEKFLPQFVVHVDSDNSYSVVEAYQKIFNNLLKYKEFNKMVSDEFYYYDINPPKKAEDQKAEEEQEPPAQ